MIEMEDGAGVNIKVLAVSIDKLTGMDTNISSFRTMPQILLDTIAHFFKYYKNLEPGKWVKLVGWISVGRIKMRLIKTQYLTHSVTYVKK